MEISEIRVKLNPRPSDKLLAYCSATIDSAFVIRDLKIIEGTHGPFVAMPSRKLTDRCAQCGGKNHLRARFCNDCGSGLPADRTPRDPQGRVRLHVDIAHPIHASSREFFEGKIIEAYREEIRRAQLPGYKPADLSVGDDGMADDAG